MSIPSINISMINLPKEITDLEELNSNDVHIKIISQSIIFDYETEETFKKIAYHSKTKKKVVLIVIDQTDSYPESLTRYNDQINHKQMLINTCNMYPNVLMLFVSSTDLKLNNVHPNIHFFYFPEFNGWYWSLYKDVQLDHNVPVFKKFLSLNKRGDVWRQFLYKLFYNDDLLKDSYFTYHCEFDNGIDLNHKSLWNENVEFLDDWVNDYYPTMCNKPWPANSFVQLENDHLFGH